jgi:DNA-binding transcriptional regulator YiaG
MIDGDKGLPRRIRERREQVEREIDTFAATLRASAINVPAWEIDQRVRSFAHRKREQQKAWEALHA